MDLPNTASPAHVTALQHSSDASALPQRTEHSSRNLLSYRLAAFTVRARATHNVMQDVELSACHYHSASLQNPAYLCDDQAEGWAPLRPQERHRRVSVWHRKPGVLYRCLAAAGQGLQCSLNFLAQGTVL